MMTCQELTELVTDYVEGRMPLMQRVQFQLHVKMCPACDVYVKQLEETRARLGTMPAEPMPDHVRDELLARFRSFKR